MEGLVDYHSKLAEHKLETEKEYQKVVLQISGGALIVSLTFSDNIVSVENSLFSIILVAGWLSLLVTVLLQLYYYRKVSKCSKELILKIETIIEKKETQADIHGDYLSKMNELDFLNKISVVTMFAGLALISIFFSVNILMKPTNNNESVAKIMSKILI